MAPMTHTTQTGLTQILARFGRKTERKNPTRGSGGEGREEGWRDGRWLDAEVSSRGL